jgi:carbamoyl-phosphate synthase large subunit
VVFKVNEARPNMVDHIISGDVALLINTPLGKQSQFDDYAARRAAIQYGVPYITTLSAAAAAADAISALRSRKREVRSIQERTAGLLSDVAASAGYRAGVGDERVSGGPIR